MFTRTLKRNIDLEKEDFYYENSDPKHSEYIDNRNFQMDMFPDDKIQEKVDFYITPYNNEISLQKYMDFGSYLNFDMVKNTIKAKEGIKKEYKFN